MKVNRDDIEYVLSLYKFDFVNDKQEIFVNKILELYNNSKTLFKMSDKIIFIFDEIAHYRIDKKTAKKIVYDISAQKGLSDLIEDFQNCDIIKDKIEFDRNEYVITLKVHNDFIVKTDLACQKTYINGKFYYDIEEQDLLECYCEFVKNNCIYVLYNKRRFLSIFGLTYNYLQILINKNKLTKLKKDKNVYMIFTNTELLYKAE